MICFFITVSFVHIIICNHYYVFCITRTELTMVYKHLVDKYHYCVSNKGKPFRNITGFIQERWFGKGTFLTLLV